MKRPILYLAIPFSLGIASSKIFVIPAPYIISLGVALVILALLFIKKRAISHAAIYLAIFLLGVISCRLSDILSSDHISRITTEEPEKVLVRGIIVDDPAISATFYDKEKESFLLRVSAYKKGAGWRSASGLVKADLYSDKAMGLSFGDEVILKGMLSTPSSLKNPGAFNYAEYLKIKGIYSVLKVHDAFFAHVIKKGGPSPEGTAYKVRRKIRGAFDSHFDSHFSGFLKAILIGDRTDLGEGIMDDFVKAGTVHIISVSGLNVGLIAGIILVFFGMLRVPRKAGLFLTLILLIFYAFMAGSNPPIARSVIMFGIVTVAHIIRRESDMLNSLAAAALLILLWNPKELFDPSFQLSFASIASIIIFTPKINHFLGISAIRRISFTEKARFYILTGASVSIAAWLGTWPIAASYFNIISPIAVLANLIMVPALFILTVLAFLFLSASMVSFALASVIARVLQVTGETVFYVNHILACLPFGYFKISSPFAGISILYYLLAGLIMAPDEMEWRRIKIRKAYAAIAILACLNILIWKEFTGQKNRYFNVTFLDVGQGDSIYMEFPGSGNLLIDGGSGGEEEKFDIGRSVIAPYLWNRGVFKIDAVMVTHFHEDHLGGVIYVLNNFKVGCVIDNGARAENSRVYETYVRAIQRKNIRRIIVGEGDTIGPFGGVKIFILNPEKNIGGLIDSNDNSIVAKVVYKNLSLLLCGDIKDKAMSRLLSYGKFLNSDIIKIPHHAGRLGDEITVGKFFKTVSPTTCIISSGRVSRYKVPSASTMNIVTSLKSMNYNTTDSGAIDISVAPGAFKVGSFVRKN